MYSCLSGTSTIIEAEKQDKWGLTEHSADKLDWSFKNYFRHFYIAGKLPKLTEKELKPVFTPSSSSSLASAASAALSQASDTAVPLLPPFCLQLTWAVSVLDIPLLSLCTLYGFFLFLHLAWWMRQMQSRVTCVSLGQIFLTSAVIPRVARSMSRFHWPLCPHSPTYSLLWKRHQEFICSSCIL